MQMFSTVYSCSGVRALTIAPNRDSTISIRSRQGNGCKVCTGSGRSQQCSTYITVNDSTPMSVAFDCSNPEAVFNVEIIQNIGKSGRGQTGQARSTVLTIALNIFSVCSTTSCNSHIIQDDHGSLPLEGFDRKFTWLLKASPPKALKIDFARTGLRQTNVTDGCRDGHLYTLQAFQATGSVVVGKYCRGGQIASAQILDQGSFSVDVPAGEKLQRDLFDVRVGDEIKCEFFKH